MKGESDMRRILILSIIVLLLFNISSFISKAEEDTKEKVYIALVRGTYTEKAHKNTNIKIYFGNVKKTLDSAGIKYAVLSDEDVIQGKLKSFKLAIFPHNPHNPVKELKKINDFIKNGGKIIQFYSLPWPLCIPLGIKMGIYNKEKYVGQFASMKFEKDLLYGAPDSFKQNSWNITSPKIAKGTKILAYWFDSKGKKTVHPAITLNENGIFVSHVLIAGDWENKTRFITAAVGHFIKGVWKNAADKSLKSAVGSDEYSIIKL